jgi:hypothetical protein
MIHFDINILIRKHSPQHSILWFCNIQAVKKKISIFDMYIPCEASSWILLHQNRKLSSRISLQNQLFCLCRLPAVYEYVDIKVNHILIIHHERKSSCVVEVLVEENSRRRFARYVHVKNWNFLFYCLNIAKSENAMLWRMLSRLETCIVYSCIW